MSKPVLRLRRGNGQNNETAIHHGFVTFRIISVFSLLPKQIFRLCDHGVNVLTNVYRKPFGSKLKCKHSFNFYYAAALASSFPRYSHCLVAHVWKMTNMRLEIIHDGFHPLAASLSSARKSIQVQP